jgi:hypothetical protein
MKMHIKTKDNGEIGVYLDDRAWISHIGLRLSQHKVWKTGSEGMVGGNWRISHGEDKHGDYELWERVFSLDDVPLIVLSLQLRETSLLISGELLRDIDHLRREDSFEDATLFVPTFTFPDELSFFLSTFGLGDADGDYPGGYWPTTNIGRGPIDLPDQAFAPMVLFSQSRALAISPANLFLTSPLVKTEAGVGRGLHGAVDQLPAGTRLETLFALGDDVPSALMHLGDILLARGGKERPRPGNHLLTSSLGWWNAYGSYYTELIRQLDEHGLSEVVDDLKEDDIPLGYLGLDLWYPYKQIGQAIQYIPDPKKYPEGLQPLAERTGLSYVFHLSALSPDNAYRTDGADPGYYRKVAQELSSQQGLAAWHDWLRTQQHLSSSLRNDPATAEGWFAGMAEAFAQEDIMVMLCMQTMGMNLASTQHRNVIAARSHTDFFFAQREALTAAAALGHGDLLEAWTPPSRLHQQNLLMGMVLYSLGMLPFYDLFLTRPHPGLGGYHPEEEAVLRALSCGPLGIGDGPGMTDRILIERLLLPDGSVAHPDHPPFPLMETINKEVQAFFTEHDEGESKWGYLLLLNTSDDQQPYAIDPPLAGDYLIWNGFSRKCVPTIEGIVGPGRLAYYVLVPEREEIGVLGLMNALVPMPQGLLAQVSWNDGWHVKLRKKTPSLAILSRDAVHAQASEDRSLDVTRQDDLWIIDTRRVTNEVHIYRR